MNNNQVPVEEVKRCFLLANALKERARHHKKLGLSVLGEEYNMELDCLMKLNNSKLSSRITDKVRLNRYDSMNWYKSEISLEKAGVWPKMHGVNISLTTENVPHSALSIESAIKNNYKSVPEKLKLKIDSLREITEFIYENFPLIFFPGGEVREKDYNVWARENNQPLCNIYDFDIDDGCSRAISYWLEGVKKAPGFFAEYKD